MQFWKSCVPLASVLIESQNQLRIHPKRRWIIWQNRLLTLAAGSIGFCKVKFKGR